MKWTLTYDNGFYILSLNDKYIKLNVNSTFNKEIDITSKNMSKDSIIFFKHLYPTLPEDNYAVIGKAYLYKDSICIDESFVDVEIIDTNIQNPKQIVEEYWL